MRNKFNKESFASKGLSIDTPIFATTLFGSPPLMLNFNLNLTAIIPYLWEISAAILSLWCVWLAAKNNILNWPIAMLASVIYAYVFYQNRFFSETYLQGIFFLFQIFGWWYWSSLNPQKTEKTIHNLPKSHILPLTGVFLLAYFVWLKIYLSYHPNAQQPYLDTFLTVLSVTALWMQARRWIENWYLWILADLFYVPMFFWGKQYITAALYGVFIILATKGYFMWRREMKKAV
jgi:nicotinamide mononucleotide transporter